MEAPGNELGDFFCSKFVRTAIGAVGQMALAPKNQGRGRMPYALRARCAFHVATAKRPYEDFVVSCGIETRGDRVSIFAIGN